MREIDIYGPADRAIQVLDREAVREFGKLKMARFDEIHLIQTVTTMYRKMAKRAKEKYYEAAFEAYVLAMYLCGMNSRKAHEAAEKAIDLPWVEQQMEETNFVTLYRFNTETERKAQRLIEALAAAGEIQRGAQRRKTGDTPAPGTDAEIERAMRAWSRQVGQYAISITDAAVIEAYQDAEIEKGEWQTERDSRVCSTCRERDGKRYRLHEIPVKPHWGCRCRIKPVTEKVRVATQDGQDTKQA